MELQDRKSVWQRRQGQSSSRPAPTIASLSNSSPGGDLQQSPARGKESEAASKAPSAAVRSERVSACLRIRPLAPGESRSHDGVQALEVVGNRVTAPQDTSLDSSTGALVSPKKEPKALNELEFEFDQVFVEAQVCDQGHVFDVVGRPCVEAAFDGINSTIMAYGQTGSGKTHTMVGGGDAPELRGIIPRVAAAVIERMETACKEDPDNNVQVSMLEIYQEKIYDLLDSQPQDKILETPQSPETRDAAPLLAPTPLSLEGKVSCGSAEPATHCPLDESNGLCGASWGHALDASAKNLLLPSSVPPARTDRVPPHSPFRTPPATPPSTPPRSPRSPAASSPRPSPSPRSPVPSPRGAKGLRIREHPQLGPFVAGLSRRVVTSWAGVKAVLDEGTASRTVAATRMNRHSSRGHAIFTISINQKVRKVKGAESLQTSHIHLVDLAGSERQARSGASGQRLKESGAINKSLTLLNNVITQLSTGAQHIPYRDSTLTWLLKESLGGNSRTNLIACVSPAWQDVRETISTLRYASRAMRIQNQPTKVEDPRDATITRLINEVNELRAALAAVKVSPAKLVTRISVGVQVPDIHGDFPTSENDNPKRSSFAFQVLAPLHPEENLQRGQRGLTRFGSAIHQAPLDSREERGESRRRTGEPVSFGASAQILHLPSSSSSPSTSSIPVLSGHQAASALLQRVHAILSKPRARDHDARSTLVPQEASSTIPLPSLDPVTSLLHLKTEDGTMQWVQYRLPPGVTKVGSGTMDIRFPGLEQEHCEVLHIPAIIGPSGTRAGARVSVLLYGGARATVNGHPLLRYALLEPGAELRLGPDSAPVILRYYDPDNA